MKWEGGLNSDNFVVIKFVDSSSKNKPFPHNKSRLNFQSYMIRFLSSKPKPAAALPLQVTGFDLSSLKML